MNESKVQSFKKVQDKTGKPIRRLWERASTGMFYTQLRVENPATGRRNPQKFSLGAEIKTIPQALQRIAEMVASEKKGTLRGNTVIPTFGEYLTHYLRTANKSKHSMENEKSFLTEWQKFFGSDRKLDKINEVQIREHLTQLREDTNKRTGKILSAQSRNLRLYALRSMLRMAKNERKIERFPFDGIKKENHIPEKKVIPAIAVIEKYVEFAIAECPKSGRQFADYLRLLMYTGGRETEVLSLQWGDITFGTRKSQVHFHRNTKFGKSRHLDFNRKLEAHLKEMHRRRNPKSEWLFPSPRPNVQDGRITNFRQTMAKVRKKVGVYLSDHYLRHYFTSQCVMAGVDRIVLANWLGHSDGGKLIAQVYGHLSREYEQSQAKKITNL